jgi:hypothetical protein
VATLLVLETTQTYKVKQTLETTQQYKKAVDSVGNTANQGIYPSQSSAQ